MARGLSRHSWQITVVLFSYTVSLSVATQNIFPEFHSLSVLNVNSSETYNDEFTEVEFEVRGRNLFGGMQIKTTKTAGHRDSLCEDFSDYNISELFAFRHNARFVAILPRTVRDNVYFCLSHEINNDLLHVPGNTINWYHQGQDVYLNNVFDLAQHIQNRKRREFDDTSVRITGIRVDSSSKEVQASDTGVPSLLVGTKATLRLFGTDLTDTMLITFTESAGKYTQVCEFPTGGVFMVNKGSLVHDTITVDVDLPELSKGDSFYVCVKDKNSTKSFIHQGSESWVALSSYKNLVPVWAAIVIITTCLCFSALFSGLNLGLMSLDKTEIKILCNTGTPQERKYAKKIQPVRDHGNYLLCSILLGNVLVNSIFTILMDGLTSGLIAVLFSTIAIVLFGEITPQAICSRHGLAVGAKTIFITKIVMGLTFPLSYPVSKILDCILGEEIGNVYNRERLKELVKVTTGENDLDRDEVNIISGALELRRKMVSEVMTRIEDAFMLDYDSILDFETVSEIMKSGYSRIPVYEGDRKKIVTTLYIKDLAFVDPDDNTPLKTLCQFYQNPCNFVFEDVTLDIMFKDFKEGNKGHMAFVHRVNNEGEGDPFYETIGLITLEDVIEELIQAEIMDETDVFTDNRNKRRRTANRSKQDFTIFAERRGESNRIRISPQLTLATFQYLSTTVDLFKPNHISETILRRLLKQDILLHIKRNKDWRNDPSTIIYMQGKPVDYFILILEGRVEVMVGQEHLVFESGPFTYFGTQALTQNVGVVDPPTALGSLQSLNMDTMIRCSFQPDYTVRACTELLFMKVKRSLYLAAKKATLMERSQKDNAPGEFDEEVEKLLHSLGEEDSLGRSTPEPKVSAVLHNTRSDSLTAPQFSSPKSPPAHPILSPTAKNFINVHDVNGSLRMHLDDTIIGKEEEASLLPKKL